MNKRPIPKVSLLLRKEFLVLVEIILKVELLRVERSISMFADLSNIHILCLRLGYASTQLVLYL